MAIDLSTYKKQLIELTTQKIGVFAKSHIGLLVEIIERLQDCKLPEELLAFLLEKETNKFFKMLELDEDNQSKEEREYQITVPASYAIKEFINEKLNSILQDFLHRACLAYTQYTKQAARELGLIIRSYIDIRQGDFTSDLEGFSNLYKRIVKQCQTLETLEKGGWYLIHLIDEALKEANYTGILQDVIQSITTGKYYSSGALNAFIQNYIALPEDTFKGQYSERLRDTEQSIALLLIQYLKDNKSDLLEDFRITLSFMSGGVNRLTRIGRIPGLAWYDDKNLFIKEIGTLYNNLDNRLINLKCCETDKKFFEEYVKAARELASFSERLSKVLAYLDTPTEMLDPLNPENEILYSIDRQFKAEGAAGTLAQAVTDILNKKFFDSDAVRDIVTDYVMQSPAEPIHKKYPEKLNTTDESIAVLIIQYLMTHKALLIEDAKKGVEKARNMPDKHKIKIENFYAIFNGVNQEISQLESSLNDQDFIQKYFFIISHLSGLIDGTKKNPYAYNQIKFFAPGNTTNPEIGTNWAATKRS